MKIGLFISILLTITLILICCISIFKGGYIKQYQESFTDINEILDDTLEIGILNNKNNEHDFHNNEDVSISNKKNKKAKKENRKKNIEEIDMSQYVHKSKIPNLNKYVLKSSIQYPDMSKYILKSEIKACPIGPDMSKYIKKSNIPSCPVAPDMSKYVLKSSVPANVPPTTCPPQKVCPPQLTCPPEKTCPPQIACPPQKKCPPQVTCPPEKKCPKTKVINHYTRIKEPAPTCPPQRKCPDCNCPKIPDIPKCPPCDKPIQISIKDNKLEGTSGNAKISINSVENLPTDKMRLDTNTKSNNLSINELNIPTEHQKTTSCPIYKKLDQQKNVYSANPY